jgi:formylmethanofuran dehydrogenase subunit E
MDFGKMAATFVNLRSGKAVRVLAKEESKDLAKNYCPEINDKYQRQTEAYKVMTDDELFKWHEVKVEIPEHDMPGRPVSRIQCGRCGEYVQDRREVLIKGKTLCKACAHGKYYKALE